MCVCLHSRGFEIKWGDLKLFEEQRENLQFQDIIIDSQDFQVYLINGREGEMQIPLVCLQPQSLPVE